jgi:hypothetical protein
MREKKILLKGTFSSDLIDVIISEHSNRKIDPRSEEEIEKQWQKIVDEYSTSGKKIWNGHSYSLNSFNAENNRLRLELSYIDYKTRRGLGMIDTISDLGFDYLPRGVTVATIFCTHDDYYVVGQRNGLVSDNYPIDLIGGILLKDEGEVKTAQDLERALLLEISEEINLKKEDIQSMIFKGIALTYMYNIILVYLTKTHLTKKEVEKRFNELEEKEFSDLIFMKKEEFYTFLNSHDGYLSLLPELF